MTLDPSRLRPATRLVHGGVHRTHHGETAEALFLTSGYVYDDAEQAEATFAGTVEHYQYSRFANPTLAMLEQRLALIEGAEDCRTTATGHGRRQRRAAVAPQEPATVSSPRAPCSAPATGSSPPCCRNSASTPSSSTAPTWRSGKPRCPARPTSFCWKPPPIRCSNWSTCRPWRTSPTRPGRSSWSTMSSPRRCCSSRSNSAPTSSSTPAPSTWTGRAGCSAEPSSAAGSGSTTPCSHSSATPAPPCHPSTPGCC